MITSSSSSADKSDASWIVRSGLANSSCVSLESKNYPGDYLRHQNYQLHTQHNDGSTLFAADVTFCPQAGKSGQGTSLASYNFPGRFIRRYNNAVSIASNGGSHNFDGSTPWADDVSWVVDQLWA